MIEYKKLPETMIIDCSAHGFGPFSVLCVPMPNEHSESARNFYLIHSEYSVVLYMFGLAPDSDEHAAEIAYNNAVDYIPEFIKQCFDENE